MSRTDWKWKIRWDLEECKPGVLGIIGIVLGGLALFVLIAFLLGWAVMSLWNALMPPIFGLPTIGYWQAIGLFILGHLLFGGHSISGHGKRDSRNRRSYSFRIEDFPPEQRERIRQRIEEEISSLPIDEQERIRKGTSRCC